MAKNVLRLEGDEVSFFHQNYVYMWKKLNTAPYYVSGFGELPPWIREEELLPSYVNLSKCMNPEFVPSVNIVNKIVRFYNANIAPSIDTYTFLHERLEDSDRSRTPIACSSAAPYCGEYYGYYYSEAEDAQYIRGALLRLYEDSGELRARLITDIVSDEDLKGDALKKLIRSGELTAESFGEYKSSLPLNKKLMLYYSGGGKVNPGVVTLQLQRSDRDGNFLTVYMPVAPSGDGQFIGGLGVVFLVSAERNFQFFRAGFERAGHPELSPLSIDDPKLKELLAFNKGANERVIMSPADNTAWTNYMVLR